MRALVVLLALFALCHADDAKSVTMGVKGEDGKYCIVFEGIIEGSIKYHNDKTNTTETFNFFLDTLKEDESRGECGDEVQTLKAKFAVNDIGSLPNPWTLTISFNKSANASKEDTVFDVLDYSLETDTTKGLNTTGKIYKRSKDAEVKVEAHLERAYKCSLTGFALEDESTVKVRAGRIVAFASLDNTTFPEKVDLCFLDAKTADIVPIVVGLCLAALIFIVLIAYCIGRARARREGYSSV